MRRTTLCLGLLLATLSGCRRETPPPPTAETEPACPSFVLRSAGLPATGEWRTHPAIGDVNGDGLDDVAALPRKENGTRVFLSDGLGGWADASEGLEATSGFSCGVGTRLVDLDGDGFLDLVIADHCSGVAVYLGNGGQSWVAASDGIPRNLSGFNDADVGDIDGDGLLDIVAISAFTRGFLVLEGRRNGTWRPLADTGLPASGSGWQLNLEDLNADGRLDVACSFSPVTTDRRTGPIPPAKVWIQGPDGRFTAADGFTSDGRYFSVATFPRPGQGVPDLILGVTGYHAGLYTYESTSGAAWTDAGRIDESWLEGRQRGYAGVHVDDMNGDGCVDLLTNEAGARTVLIALGDCQGGLRLCPVQTVPSPDVQGAGWGLATGDFNGDGRRDIVSGFGTAQGGLRAWYQAEPKSPL